jgi:hypothetical protein
LRWFNANRSVGPALDILLDLPEDRALAEIEVAIEAIVGDSKKLIAKRLLMAIEAGTRAQKEAVETLRETLNYRARLIRQVSQLLH